MAQAARISLQQLAKLAERMGRQTSGATEAGLSQKQLDKILDELATAMGEWSAGPKWQQQIAKHADMEAGMAMPHILQQILKGGGGLRLPQIGALKPKDTRFGRSVPWSQSSWEPPF